MNTKEIVRLSSIVLSWLTATVTTVVLNKYIFQVMLWKFPLTLTVVHMIVCMIGSFIAIKVLKLIPLATIESSEYYSGVLPLSVIFCVNIVLGNISLQYIPVSFMQTIKSSVPAFTVFLERLVLGTAQERLIYFSVAPIVGGVSLASWSEAEFHFTGFIAALVASVVTAWLSLLTAKLLQTKLDAVNLLYYMAPLSALFLLPIALYFESSGIIQNWGKASADDHLQLVVVLAISGAVAFSLNVFTFLIINTTSALTYTVLGNVKVVFSITISVLIFRNQVGFLNALGCVITLAGAAWYQSIKRAQNNKQHQQKTELPVDNNPKEQQEAPK